MSIQVLAKDVINQIAAGEVVERPAHLVKELIENSIDAGATEITVETNFGGRSVRVADNGDGILRSEMARALERHATSKIRASDDLWKLQTFGFRGEALASIAAVSKLTIHSVQKAEQLPSQIQVRYGNVSAVAPSSRTVGTEILIEDLFENVPARLKFLKSDTAEAQQIKQIIKAIALAHPQVQIKLIQDGQLQSFFKTQDSKSQNIWLLRVQSVLEKETLHFTTAERGNFKVEIAFSSPHEVVKTSKQIWIFVQNRFVQDRALQAAVLDAYRSLLMHGEYPLVVVKLHCEPSEIDVNIHPTKSQVKFRDSATAFRAVHGALRAALETAPWIPKGAGAGAGAGAVTDSYLSGVSAAVDSYSAFVLDSKRLTPNLSFQDQSMQMTHFKQKDFSMTSSPPASSDSLQELRAQSLGYWSQVQILGQANLTYIICQKEDRLIYVDQHAAHERVVFESLMQSWKSKSFEIQEYLFPFVIDLSADKVEALLGQQNAIAELGIVLEQLGPMSLGIKSAPSLIKDSALPPLFEKMATEIIDYGGSYAIEKKVGDIFASMACHSVVRAGQSLSHLQMHELLISMDQFALSSFCPHGRPVSVETSFLELEKLFGRIN